MKEGMQKSPSMVFELLAEEDKAKVEEKYRRSIDQRLSSSSRSSRQVRQVVSESAAEEETEEEKEEGKGGAGEAGWERRQGEAQGELQQLHEALLLPGASLQQMVREELGDLFIDTRHLHLQEPLGEGGFAVVHKALLQLPGRHAVSVAVKQLKGQEAMVDADKLREFVQEARLLYKVQCPHLVGLQGIGAFDMSSWTSFRNSLFIVQDLMEGGTLKDAVIRQMLSQKKHVYRAADALRWCLCVAHACHYLHSCQPVVVHRDLKLENILLEGGALDCAKAKVADLGLHMRLRRGARGEKSVYAAAAFADGSVGNGALFCASIGRSRNRRAAPHLHPQQHCLSSGSEATQSNASGRDLSAARVRDGGSEGAAASGEAADSVQQLLFLRHPAKEAADAEPLQLHRTESAHGARSALSLLQSSAAGGDAAAQPLAQPPERTSNGLPIVKAPREPKRLLDAAGAGSMTLSEKIQRVEELALTQRGRDQAAADGTNPSSITSSRDDTLHKLAAAIEKAKGLDGRSSKWSEHTQTMKVGSLMYMAPEVMVGSTYSEKVDVFSFGVMMFEICSGRVNMAKIAVEGDAEQVAVYAEKVAGGWREDLPVGVCDTPSAPDVVAAAAAVGAGWPKELRELISACWSHASSERPSFKEVVRKLQQMQRDTAVAEALDAYTQKRAAYDPMNDCGCGCCLM